MLTAEAKSSLLARLLSALLMKYILGCLGFFCLFGIFASGHFLTFDIILYLFYLEKASSMSEFHLKKVRTIPFTAKYIKLTKHVGWLAEKRIFFNCIVDCENPRVLVELAAIAM